MIFSALMVTSSAFTAPTISTSSLPSSPFTIRSTPATSNELIVSTSLLRNGMPRSPPKLIVKLLEGSLKVIDSNVMWSDTGASVRVSLLLSVSSARSSKSSGNGGNGEGGSRSLMLMTLSATELVSVIGSSPA